jgi:hypothetical protein
LTLIRAQTPQAESGDLEEVSEPKSPEALPFMDTGENGETRSVMKLVAQGQVDTELRAPTALHMNQLKVQSERSRLEESQQQWGLK